ncbi:MAG: helix-turn-helix domain-containing protein [Ardenticatenaceae bacterium]|nr:helix-turn-helix domain-containing protein [Ardenticatenaceae bacterium]
MMTDDVYVPQGPLADFVELMWVQREFDRPHTLERVLPTGEMTLSINFDRREATIGGAHTRPFVLNRGSMSSHIGVHFKPGGAFPFLPVPAADLQNELVSLDSLWGQAVFSWRDQLLEARLPTRQFRLMERLLLSLAPSAKNRHPAVEFAVDYLAATNGAQPLTYITDQIGLSSRRLRQLFADQVGLTPKVYGRVRRFQNALTIIGHNEQIDWADIALACGYFDQAHFAHEFRKFSGLTPTMYLAAGKAERNHIPLSQ